MLTLNIEDVEKLSIELSQMVETVPELVAYVAKGSYLIGQTLSDIFKVPLLEIETERSGSRLKDLASPFLRLLPNRLKLWLRKKELNTGVHANYSERYAVINSSNKLLEHDFRTILLVDDSVDTGNTILATKKILKKSFPNANISTAAFVVFEASKSLVKIDYSLFNDKIISAPWSRDSKYYREFLHKYEEMKIAGII
jgi:hypoxanthine phosphoribosyltransferase